MGKVSIYKSTQKCMFIHKLNIKYVPGFKKIKLLQLEKYIQSYFIFFYTLNDFLSQFTSTLKRRKIPLLSKCIPPYAMSTVLNRLNFIISYLPAGKDLEV